MPELSERLNTPISSAELERRWVAVRRAMEERKVDVLLMQNNNDFMGGYVKYFTDQPATNGYPITVTFPRDDRMSMVMQGAFGTDQRIPAQGDAVRRGIRRVLGTPSYASAGYSLAYEAELAEKALEPYGQATIGLVGLGTLPISMIDRLRTRYSGAKFLDATDLVDEIKVIKSDEEIALIRRTAALQDAALEAALKAAAPGKRDIEIAAIAEHVVLNGGGEQGIFLCDSYTPGEPAPHANRHLQNRGMKKGDMFSLLVESNGPGGFYTETSRTIVLGRATQAMKDELEIVLAARKNTLGLLKPGVSCADIWESHNKFMRDHKRPEEHRLYCHGQGYDLVERPLVRYDEPFRIRKNMNIVCHPGYLGGGFLNGICDNYLIGESGVTERLHKLPEKIYELE
jgi:Xaa-Pro aminopeptidase